MCTDHTRALAGPIAATRTSIPLRPRAVRWSRRRLLFNAGIGTAGVAILGACSSDDAGDPPPSDEGDTPASAASDEAPATSEPIDDQAESTTTEPGGPPPELQLEHVDLGFVSAYVLTRGSEAMIVDTGTSGSGPAIDETLRALGLTPADVRHVVLTHEHGDHVGGLAELEEALSNATVYAGPGDVDSVRTSLTLQEVVDGDEVFGLGIVQTPGHTPGSISVFDTTTGLLVAGDAINGDGSGGLTGANPDFTPDMTTADASVSKLAALMPSVAAFGHGGPPVIDDVAAKLTALAG